MLSLGAVNAKALIVEAVLAGASAGCLVYWTIALWRIVNTLRLLPTARAGLRLPAPDKRVCLIVPAHNEEQSLPGLIESLMRQDMPGARFVLALDRCTDGTAEAARRAIGDDERFEIIEIDSCPADWAGKVHAAWQAVQRSAAAADADVLAFTDADCEFEPGCLRACAALMEDRNLDLLSLLSTLRMKKWFELVCQPAAALELMRHHPPERANRNGEGHRAFANGQFMMFRSDAYRRIGGHAAVRDALLEDIALAKRMAHGPERFRTGLLSADGMVRCAMYETWRQFRDGWRRIFIEASGRKSRRMVSHAWQARLVGTVFPCGALAAAAYALAGEFDSGTTQMALGLLAGLALLVWFTALTLLARAGGSAGWTVVFHPVGTWLVGRILLEGAKDLVKRRPTRWGGRDYVLEDRS
ncbi:MAG: hypothetical protein Kow0022_05650 [Phycisphaerales bacterium]